jgi:hypothetical protein
MANTFNTILGAVKDVLTTAIAPVTVKRRKKFVMKKTDIAPLVVVTQGGSSRPESDSEGNIYKSFEVFVTLLYAGNAILESGFTLLETQQEIERSLDVPSLSGVSSVYDSEVHTDISYDTGQLAQGVEANTIRIIYYVYETRN